MSISKKSDSGHETLRQVSQLSHHKQKRQAKGEILAGPSLPCVPVAILLLVWIVLACPLIALWVLLAISDPIPKALAILVARVSRVAAAPRIDLMVAIPVPIAIAVTDLRVIAAVAIAVPVAVLISVSIPIPVPVLISVLIAARIAVSVPISIATLVAVLISVAVGIRITVFRRAFGASVPIAILLPQAGSSLVTRFAAVPAAGLLPGSILVPVALLRRRDHGQCQCGCNGE